MEYRKLYITQLEQNKELKVQIGLLETILRNYIPIIEKKEDE